MTRLKEAQIDEIGTSINVLPLFDEIQIAAWKQAVAGLEYIIKTTEEDT